MVATSVIREEHIAAIEVWDFPRRSPVELEGEALGEVQVLDRLEEGGDQAIQHGLANEGAERPSLREATSEGQELAEQPGTVPWEEVP